MATVGKLERYRDIRTLGRGGMATVVLAQDTLLGREVALKRLHAAAAEAGGLSRLRREALIGASISHPNVVSIYDVANSEDGDLVIVMEYVKGENLRDALEREDRLPAREALRVISAIAAGLDAIHERGIVHRDVKPANILLGIDGSVKLADLGIASVPDRTRITTAGTLLGSFAYMAPEQLEEGPATPAIDVYALGAVAFETLSGQKAHPEANPLAVAHAISSGPPPDLQAAWPEAPPAAAAAVARAMAREPDRRPRSAGEFAESLGVALAPPPRPARRPPATAPARRVAVAADIPERRSAPTASPARDASPGRDRRRSPAALLAVLGLLLLAGVVVAAILSSGGTGSKHSAGTTAASRHRPASSRSATARSRAPKTSTGATQGAPTTAGQTASTPAGSSASAATPPASTTPAARTPANGTGATAATRSAGGPVGAVETFYSLAASHQYQRAWALADPNFQAQLGGYNSFAAGQSGDIAIRFNSAQIVSQSADSATVAVRTTSVRTTGTQHCAGTVMLKPGSSGGSWLLHQISINCA